MSFNARWRCFKIVAPLDKNKEQEIVGGLKNALERGEDLTKAKKSFLNAGYKPEEIEAAVQKMPAITTIVNQQDKTTNKTQASVAQTGQPQITQPLPIATTEAPGQKKGLSKKFIIILISSAVSVLLVAGLIGVFWNKIF